VNADSEVVVALLGGGDVHAGNHEGWTSLMKAAAFNRNPRVVAVLLEAGAEIEARSEENETALMKAATHTRNPEILLTSSTPARR
jgi:ankyrin repeat protein